MKNVNPGEVKLKAGNGYFAMQHSQSDASPSMLVDSLFVLRQCCISKTNKTFNVLEGLPSLLKGLQDLKDHEVVRLKFHQLQCNAHAASA